MKKAEMRCKTCIKYDEADGCRLSSVPDFIVDPANHWCAQGLWRAWCPKLEDFDFYYWGDWDPE